MHPIHRPARLFAPTLIALAVTACGGGSSEPEAKSQARADSSTVLWNRATALSVTSNDTAENGTPSLSVPTPPAHGTAIVQGNTILYTPAPGYFGPDTFTYRLHVGNKVSDATVAVTVNAELSFTGVVRDAVLPGASVVAVVDGAPSAPVTAGADGSYTIKITTADPTDFISLKATGAGAQSNVVLTSLVGGAQEVAAAAGADATVQPSELPATNVTHVSTAFAVLAEQALGKTITSTAELSSAEVKVNTTQAVEMAAAIKLVADMGVALPTGAANTLALVSNPEAYKSFVTTQAVQNPTAFQAAVEAVVTDAAIATTPAAPTAGQPVVLLLLQGEGASASNATKLTLKSDGTALYEGSTVRSAKWETVDNQTKVVFDEPVVSESFNVDPASGVQERVEYRWSGLTVRQLAGTSRLVMASTSNHATAKWLTGSLAGQPVGSIDEPTWDTQTMVKSTMALTSADLAAGTRWAGVVAPDSNPAAGSGRVHQDVMTVVDTSSVKFERLNQTFPYQLEGGKLRITIGDATYTYERAMEGPRGEERWVATKSSAGQTVWVLDAAMVKLGGAASFTAEGVAQRWLSYINVGVTSDKFVVHLRGDGTAQSYSDMLDGRILGVTPASWTLIDGAAVISRPCTLFYCPPGWFHRRTWTPLVVTPTRITVMERLQIGWDSEPSSYDQYRVNVYDRLDPNAGPLGAPLRPKAAGQGPAAR